MLLILLPALYKGSLLRSRFAWCSVKWATEAPSKSANLRRIRCVKVLNPFRRLVLTCLFAAGPILAFVVLLTIYVPKAILHVSTKSMFKNVKLAIEDTGL